MNSANPLKPPGLFADKSPLQVNNTFIYVSPVSCAFLQATRGYREKVEKVNEVVKSLKSTLVRDKQQFCCGLLMCSEWVCSVWDVFFFCECHQNILVVCKVVFHVCVILVGPSQFCHCSYNAFK